MDEAELKRTIARVDAMAERCEAVARRAIPIKPDMSLPRYEPKPAPPITEKTESKLGVRKLRRDSGYSPIASGELTGHEMRLRDHCGCGAHQGDFMDEIFAGFDRACEELRDRKRPA